MTHVGAAPAVDRLIVVAHDAEILVLGGQRLHELVLRDVGVLELVHQHVIEAAAPVREALGMLREQRQRVQQQVVEVHRIGLLQRGRQRAIDLGRDLGERAVGVGGETVGRHHPVLGARDERMHRARRIDLGRMAARLEQTLDQRLRVVLVVDRVVGPEAEQRRLAAQQPGVEGMERPDPQARGFGAKQRGDAAAHLARRLVRERDREDALGPHAAVFDQMGDPRGEHARLARARAREHEQRAARMLHRRALGVVEGQRHETGASGSSTTKTLPRPPSPGA